jgi:Ca-activated chloride channel family protein
MRFLSASALWWLLLAGPIVLLYILRKRRQRLVVPSTLLWRRALDEIEATVPFKRLRRNLLLLLQLLALAAIVLALARPALNSTALVSGSTVIIIDATASMGARDENGGRASRMDRAKQLAREMIAGLGGGRRAALVEASSKAVLRSPLTADAAALVAAIDQVDQTDAAGDTAEAIILARQIIKAEPDPSIVLIGDGGGTGSEPIDAGAVPTRFVRVGTRSDNVGIIAMNSRRLPDGRQELFASVANFGDSSRTFGVELKLDGKLVDARTVSIGGRPGSNGGSDLPDRRAITWDALPQSGGLAELRLDIEDDLAADNVAYAMVPDSRLLRVGIASDNRFLLQALAVNPDLEIVGVGTAVTSSPFDLVVAEGQLASEFLATGRSVLAVNPSDVRGIWTAASSSGGSETEGRVTGSRSAPAEQSPVEAPVSVDHSHPVNDYLSYSEVHVTGARGRAAAPWLKPIVSDGRGGLIWAGEDAGRRVVVIGFDLAASDFPLETDFPVLIADSINWLAARGVMQDSDRVIRAGQPVTLQSSAQTVSISMPSGQSRAVQARDGVASFSETDNVGLYIPSGGAPIAASLLSESESDTQPREVAIKRTGDTGAQAAEARSQREIWRWLLLGALAVLGFEWWTYLKRSGR